jgi:uncharacterized protein YxjI
MIIDIAQAKIAIADKYKIFVNGQEAYRAARKLWRFLAEVDLFTLDGHQPVLTIKKRFAFFKASYDVLIDDQAFPFTTRSLWKGVYHFDRGNDRYEIYAHRGRKYSIFRNDLQVAWWDKAAITVLAGDKYRITADDDADTELLIAFCLIVDNYASDDHDNDAVTYNVGNLLQAKKFDSAWQPRAGK